MSILTPFPHLERGEQDDAMPDGWIVAREGPPFIWRREIQGMTMLVVQTEGDKYEPQLPFCDEVLSPSSVKEEAALKAQEVATKRLFNALRTLDGIELSK